MRTTKLKIKGKEYDVLEMLKEDLRAIKREKADAEGKKHINSKDKQKNILK